MARLLAISIPLTPEEPLVLMDLDNEWVFYERADAYRPELSRSERRTALCDNSRILYSANSDGSIYIDIVQDEHGDWVNEEWVWREHPVVTYRENYPEGNRPTPHISDYWHLLNSNHAAFLSDEMTLADHEANAHRYLQMLVDVMREKAGLPVGHAGVYSHGTHALAIAESDEVHIVGRGQSFGLSDAQLRAGVTVGLLEKPDVSQALADQELAVGGTLDVDISNIHTGNFLSHEVHSDASIVSSELRRNVEDGDEILDLVIHLEGVAVGTATVTLWVINPSGEITQTFSVAVSAI